MQFCARLWCVPGAHTILFGPMVTELLNLSSATRTELLHNGLLLCCAGVQQLQNLSAYLHMNINILPSLFIYFNFSCNNHVDVV